MGSRVFVSIKAVCWCSLCSSASPSSLQGAVSPTPWARVLATTSTCLWTPATTRTRRCTRRTRIVYDEKCIPYMEKTCYTQQQEQCKEVYEKNCTAVIDEFEERECFDVTELMCSLAESIQYEMVDETYTVQRCTGVTDRVCDTVYDLAQSTKDDFQCVDIEYQYCWDEDKIVKDRTCVFSVDFDCKKRKPFDGQG